MTSATPIPLPSISSLPAVPLMTAMCPIPCLGFSHHGHDTAALPGPHGTFVPYRASLPEIAGGRVAEAKASPANAAPLGLLGAGSAAAGMHGGGRLPVASVPDPHPQRRGHDLGDQGGLAPGAGLGKGTVEVTACGMLADTERPGRIREAPSADQRLDQ